MKVRFGPQIRTNVRSWFAPEVLVTEMRRRWSAWPIRFDLDLDLRVEDVLADLHAGRS